MGTETKHTPGKWDLQWDMGSGDYHWIVANGERIAMVETQPISNDDPDTDIEKEGKANARLIAAAPDLLAALQIIQEKIDAGESGESEMADLLLQIGKITDDAIAKATGGA